MNYNYKSKKTKVIGRIFYYLFSLFGIAALSAAGGDLALVIILAVWLAYLRLKTKTEKTLKYGVFDLDLEKELFQICTKHSFVKGDMLSMSDEGDFIVEEVRRVVIPEYGINKSKFRLFSDKDCGAVALLNVRRIYGKTGNRLFNRETDLGSKYENPDYEEKPEE